MTIAFNTASTAVEVSDKIGDDNRQWIHILPAGKFDGKKGDGPYVLDDPMAVMSATHERQRKTEMVIDYEHQSIRAPSSGKPAPAAGWITGLQARQDGIWALATWTADAAELIRKRAYRYLSPVFKFDQGSGKVRCLVNVGLTNLPNLELTAIASEAFSMDETEMNELRSLLGLAQDADFNAVKAAISALQSSTAVNSAVDPSLFVPIGEFERVVKEANSLRKGLTEERATAHVAECIRTGKLAPFLKDWAIAVCTSNFDAFEAFVDRTAPGMSHFFQETGATAAAPRRSGESLLSEQEVAVCSTLGLTEEEFIKGRVIG